MCVKVLLLLLCSTTCGAMEPVRDRIEERADTMGIAVSPLSSNKQIRSYNESMVSMRVFHELYTLMCSSNCGGDTFFNDYDVYDPATPENGNKTLRERYEEWATLNGIRIPTNGDPLF